MTLSQEGMAVGQFKPSKTTMRVVYTNKKIMTFEAMITKLNKAYNALKRQGQEFTKKSKVEQ